MNKQTFLRRPLSDSYHHLPRVLLVTLVLSVVLLVLTNRWLTEIQVAQTSEQALQRMGAFKTSLEATIERHTYLPRILASDPRIVNALTTDTAFAPGDARTVGTSRLLQAFNREAQSDEVFLMDEAGMTYWSSNYDTVNSFVGSNYAFRPYFISAMRGEQGFYFAVGATSGEPGLFLTAPVRSDAGVTLGVVVVKIDLRPLERSWANSGDPVWVTDQEGIIFLSSSPQWHYMATRALTDDHLELLANTRQYGSASVKELRRVDEWTSEHWRAFDVGDDALKMAFAGAIEQYPWTMYIHMSMADIRQQVRLKQALLLLVVFVAAGILLYSRERHRRHEAQRALQQANEVLEHRVEERTRDLKEAQLALAQNQKLAALGRMSSAIAHEINQPITALRNYTASSQLLLARNAFDVVQRNLQKMEGLTDRLSALSRQLRVFSGKRNSGSSLVSLHAPVHYALDVLQSRLEEGGIDCQLALGDDQHVQANAMMLEQILVNLLSNAIDAVKDQPEGRIDIALFRSPEGHSTLSIQDNGTGMDTEIQAKVFEPFYTTKSVGDGMGLGLAISYSLAHDMGAELTLSSAPGQGACFTLMFKSSAMSATDASAHDSSSTGHAA